jgi:hypothetical protein
MMRMSVIANVLRRMLMRSPRMIGWMMLALLGRICMTLIDSLVSMGNFGLYWVSFDFRTDRTGQERFRYCFLSLLWKLFDLCLAL